MNPLVDATVTIEELGLTTRTGKDGAWALILPRGGRYTARFDGGGASDGQSFTSVRRPLRADEGEETADSVVVLAVVDGATSQSIDGAQPVSLDFNGRYPGLSLSIPAGGLRFADGRSAGTITATRLPGFAQPLPVAGKVGPSVLWMVQPLGVRVSQPVTMALPNLSSLPPGRRAVLFVSDGDRQELVRAGFAKVSADGATLVADHPIGLNAIEVFGYALLSEEQSAAVEAALAGQTPGGSPLRRGTPQLPGNKQGILLPQPPREPQFSPWKLLGVSEAYADLFSSLDSIADEAAFGADRPPGLLTGRVRTPREDGLSMTLTARSEQGGGLQLNNAVDDFSVGPRRLLAALDQAGTSTLVVTLNAAPVSAFNGAPGYAITGAISGTDTKGKPIAPPSGETWRATWDFSSGAANSGSGLTANVELKVGGGSNRIDFDVLAPTRNTRVSLSADLSPGWDGGVPGADSGLVALPDGGYTLADGGPVTLATLTLGKQFDDRNLGAEMGIPFSKVRVSVPGLANAVSSTGVTGGYAIQIAAPQNKESSLVVADIPTPPQPVRYYDSSGVPHLSLIPTFFTARSPVVGLGGGAPVADILVDVRALSGQVTFVDRTGTPLPPDCGDSKRQGNGELTTVGAGDIATTEVHFFREEDLKNAIAKYSVVIPSSCSAPAAVGVFNRIRVGPADLNKEARNQACASMRSDPKAVLSDYYVVECSDDQGKARNFLRLRTGDGLVIFAINHATGYAGLSRV
ncbi:MAG TPA: hypothetical protein VMR96_00590, partial [Solirubrobacterales bacterium]|nr:hypothetical protein [Solirubrobacterales bacterium]